MYIYIYIYGDHHCVLPERDVFTDRHSSSEFWNCEFVLENPDLRRPEPSPNLGKNPHGIAQIPKSGAPSYNKLADKPHWVVSHM